MNLNGDLRKHANLPDKKSNKDKSKTVQRQQIQIHGATGKQICTDNVKLLFCRDKSKTRGVEELATENGRIL